MKYYAFFTKQGKILPTEVINARYLKGTYYKMGNTDDTIRCYRLHDVVEAKEMQFKMYHDTRFAEIHKQDIDEKQLIKLTDGTLCLTETEFLRLKDTASMEDVLQPINKL